MCSDLPNLATYNMKNILTIKSDIMETRKKDEEQEVVFFSLRISKRYMRLMRIAFTITAVAGVVLVYLKHS